MGLTVNKLNTFIKTAKDREQLTTSVPGLVFMKLKGGGSWRLRYTDSAGNRRVATLADHHTKPMIAEELANEWRVKIKQGQDPLQVKESARQASEADQYSKLGIFFNEIYRPALIKHGGIKSAKNNCGIIERDFGHLFDRDMAKLNAQDIRQWENKRKASGASPGLIRRNYAAFKALLNYAAGKKRNHANDHPILSVNPLADVALSQMSHDERQSQSDRQQELQQQRDLIPPATMAALMSGLDQFDQTTREKRRSSREHGKGYLQDLSGAVYAHWFIPFMHIARLTGMRPGDILTLQWQSVQTSIKTRSEVLVFRPNKTKHHNNAIQVTIPLTGQLAAVINTWRNQQGSPSSGFMFESKVSGKAMATSAYQRHWKAVKKLAGVDENLHFYSFRHNLISELVGRGVPLLRIAKLVGHKDTSMIAEHYFHEDVSDLGEILEATGNEWRSVG